MVVLVLLEYKLLGKQKKRLLPSVAVKNRIDVSLGIKSAGNYMLAVCKFCSWPWLQVFL